MFPVKEAETLHDFERTPQEMATEKIQRQRLQRLYHTVWTISGKCAIIKAALHKNTERLCAVLSKEYNLQKERLSVKTIGIIGAMPSELKDIRETLGEGEIQTKGGFSYYINQMNKDTRIVHACSGIAKVNAALCAQTLIHTFQPDALINAGIAGGMHPDVKVCDIVISTEVLPHDLDLRFLREYPPYCDKFPSNEKLIALTEKICAEKGIVSHCGRIVSGEAFISDNAVKAEIQSRLAPHAVDMESAAVGHTAYLNAVPYVSVRCISDNADDEGEMSFEQFEKIAAKRVAEVVLAVAAEFIPEQGGQAQ